MARTRLTSLLPAGPSIWRRCRRTSGPWSVPSDGGCLYGCVCAHVYGHTYHLAMRRRVHLLMVAWFHRFYGGFVTFGDRDRPFSVTIGVGDGAFEKVFCCLIFLILFWSNF